MAILGCKYAYVSENKDLIAVFWNCVVQYAKNSACTRGTMFHGQNRSMSSLFTPICGCSSTSTKGRPIGSTKT